MAVSDASAVALECALLEPLAAANHLTAALLVDPWFCRWAAPHCDGANTITELAASMASILVERLHRLPAPPPCWTRTDNATSHAFGSQAESIRGQALAVLPAGNPAADSAEFYERMLHAVPDYSAQVIVNDYLNVHPGVEWRLPRLVELVGGQADWSMQLEQAKLDAMKELAYGASHEVNNPLANISGRAQSLLRDEKDPRRQRLLKAIDRQALRAHEMISDLMLFARPPALEKDTVDLVQLTKQAVEELKDQADTQQIELQVSHESGAMLASTDPTQSLIAIQALLRNAMEAIGHGGRVTLTLQGDAGGVEVRVSDTGPGVSPEVREHLFDPFYSGREAGRGLGFGLSKCWRIAQQHGGTLTLAETSPAGSTFVLRLPTPSEEQ